MSIRRKPPWAPGWRLMHRLSPVLVEMGTNASMRTALRIVHGATATAEWREQLPGAKILILTTFGASDGIAHALEAGAAGALMKTVDDAALVSTVRAIAAGKTVVSADIKRLLAEDPPVPKLTPRQTEVLQSMTRTHKS